MKKKISLTLFILILASTSIAVPAQKKSKTSGKRPTFRTLTKPTVKKVEVENWKEYEFKDLTLKLVLPKEPTVSVSNNTEGRQVKVKASVIQSYINTDYYMVNVREYPPGIIPDRTDMGASYGFWLKTYVLSRVSIISEKSFDYNRYKMIEFVYQQMENELIVHRVMVVGDKLYQFIVQFEVKKPDTIEQTIQKNKSKLDKFFLSFELTDEEFVS
jgi:hypothetical protein